MVASTATTVEAYLDALPSAQRAAIAAVRAWIREALPDGYRETLSFGMIAWEVPLERYPSTYNGKALLRAGLAAQARSLTLHLPCVYQDPLRAARLREGARREGKKLDMGASCVRFRTPDDLPRATLAALLADLPVDAFVAAHERARAASAGRARKAPPARRPATAGRRR